jgi:putative toxin-antitoxin system antitoxin component (TIGR02293 family)
MPVTKKTALSQQNTRISRLTPMEKMQLSKKGVSKKYLEKVKAKTMLDYQKLANVLSINRATLINKKQEEKFSAAQSERIIGLDALYNQGLEVFQDKGKLNGWLNTPNKALGGKIPYDVMDNQFGREEVLNLLGRIQWGVYS